MSHLASSSPMARTEEITLLSSTYNRAIRWAAFLPQDISQVDVEGGYAETLSEDKLTDDISEQIKDGRVFSAGQL